MWDRYPGCITGRVREAVAQASIEAFTAGQEAVAPEHLLLGLLRDDGNVSSRLVRRLGVSLPDLQRAAGQRHLAESAAGVTLPLTREAALLLAGVPEQAERAGNYYIGTEHLLLALAGDTGETGRVLTEFGLTQEHLCANVRLVQEG